MCVQEHLHTYRKRSDSKFKGVNVESLKEACRKHKDNFYNGLSKDATTLTAHEKCNLEYKYLDHIRRHLKQSPASANEGQWSGGAIKRTRRSYSAIPFHFKSDCIFYGITCDVKTDDRHPNQWYANTDNRERKGKKSVKEVLLKVFFYQKQVFGAVLV